MIANEPNHDCTSTNTMLTDAPTRTLVPTQAKERTRQYHQHERQRRQMKNTPKGTSPNGYNNADADAIKYNDERIRTSKNTNAIKYNDRPAKTSTNADGPHNLPLWLRHYVRVQVRAL